MTPFGLDSKWRGHMVAYHHRYEDSDVCVFYAYAKPDDDNASLEERLREDVTKAGGQVTALHHIERWAFHPRFAPQDARDGAYERLEALQRSAEQPRTVFATAGLLDFELMEPALATATRVVREQFPDCARSRAEWTRWLQEAVRSEVGGAELPDPHASFAELGVDSLNAIRIAHRLRRASGQSLLEATRDTTASLHTVATWLVKANANVNDDDVDAIADDYNSNAFNDDGDDDAYDDDYYNDNFDDYGNDDNYDNYDEIDNIDSIDAAEKAADGGDTTFWQQVVSKAVAEELELSELPVSSDSFASLGVDSVSGARIQSVLGRRVGAQVGPTLFIEHPTIGAMGDALASMAAAKSGRKAAASRNTKQGQRRRRQQESAPSTKQMFQQQQVRSSLRQPSLVGRLLGPPPPLLLVGGDLQDVPMSAATTLARDGNCSSLLFLSTSSLQSMSSSNNRYVSKNILITNLTMMIVTKLCKLCKMLRSTSVAVMELWFLQSTTML